MIKNIPSISQCLEFHDRFQMLENIQAHSFVVARVAESLVDSLLRAGRSAGPFPDKKEVVAGALLHDIAKTICLKTNCRHAEEGKLICLELGYPELGEIVAEHVILNNFTAELYAQGIFGTKEIVFYADKRVRHDQVVSLADRLEYILERYGDNNPVREKLIHQNFNQALDFEKYFFNFLDILPEEISKYISLEKFA